MINRIARLSALALILSVSSTLAQSLNQGVCPPNQDNRFRGMGLSQDFGYGEITQFSVAQRAELAPQYYPMMLAANSIGVGAVSDIPVYKNFLVRASIFALSGYGLTSPYSRSLVLPVEFGLRLPLIDSKLGSLYYTLYAETGAGLLLGWAFPTNGSFFPYSVSSSRFSSGASGYLGLGNSLRISKYVGVYLNGGAEYLDFFSSSFISRNNFLMPEVSVGFYFNIAG